MAVKSMRLTPRQLNDFFIYSLGNAVTNINDPNEKPLLVDIKLSSFSVKLCVYLYNCTNPPGGRASDEYKSQIIVPGQQRGQHGSFVHADGRIVHLGAYAILGNTPDTGVFVFWDAMYHENFAYSANIQVKSEILIAALTQPVSIGRKNNNEKIIACRPQYLCEGIESRIMTVSL
jgi:hypothetical protein